MKVTDCENKRVRIANRIVLVKSATGNLSELKRLDKSLRVAEQSVRFVKELTIEDYFNEYLSQYAENDAILIQAARKMSRKEVGKLLKVLLRARNSSVNRERGGNHEQFTGLLEARVSGGRL